MTGGDGYRADTEAMAQITKGINLAMDELKELGFDIDANLGRGFDDLELAGLEVGDKGLQETFADFCERWGWGVRRLMQDANDFSDRLGLSAGMYHEQEQYISNTLKNTYQAVAGNPYLSEEQIENRSWDKMLEEDNVYHWMQNPDYSMDSIAKGSIGSTFDAVDQIAADAETSTWTPWQDNTDWQWEGPPEAERGAPEEGER